MASKPTVLVAMTALLLTVGCASTDLPPIERPDFQMEEDERVAWSDSARVDEALVKHGVIYQDASLQRVLDGVVARLLPHIGAAGPPVRVRVLKDPYLNAFALPNGSIYFHSGLLAEVENEAQLATVLGHELSHFVRRHGLKTQRQAENRRLANQIVAPHRGHSEHGGPGLASALLEVAESPALIQAQISGYSRELEQEADTQGFAILAAAGYDVREAQDLPPPAGR
ncbi:MAG: M48 family metalloprotease [Candidatus Binatia bacterium]